jgi:hypothetical protein
MIREFLVSNFKLYNKDDIKSTRTKDIKRRASIAGSSEKTGTFADPRDSIDKDSVVRAPFDYDT